MKMYKVVAQAKLRETNGHRWTEYWCAGKCWSALNESTHELDELKLAELKKEQEEGFPIVLVSAEEIVDEVVAEPKSPTLSVGASVPPWAQQG